VICFFGIDFVVAQVAGIFYVILHDMFFRYGQRKRAEEKMSIRFEKKEKI
jgi:hypothetical protein